MDVPGDGNCLFYACISKLQNCTTFTIEKASTNTRNYVLDYLLLHCSHFHPLCHATNRSLMPILLFKVCALLIKFASDFSVKSSSLEVFEQLFFLTFPCQSSTWAPCLYGMGQLPLFICLPPPLLINLILPAPFLTFFHRCICLCLFLFYSSIFRC